ncbi:MAG: hypothetical protein COY40_03135 [Alphaproteobacteria bacterium CG_4_10_14_0_8_um_filter_53_9]|nr:MAG: hypothetical protein COY40_03135 [Alphaproteobacteria bacterium CG_4_10_14_0_8_um_filter_53_9]
MSQKFKTNPPNQGRFQGAYGDSASGKSNNDAHPLFAFDLKDGTYCISACDKEFKAALAEKLRILSCMTWQQIRQASRKSHGFEQIKRNQVRGSLPTWLTDDVLTLSVCRFHGDAGRLIGMIDGDVFKVFLVDPRLDAYDHG